MNTDHFKAEELSELQTRASLAFDAPPPAKRWEFYEIARCRYGPSWSTFGARAKAMCALLAYIAELPEPPTRRN